MKSRPILGVLALALLLAVAGAAYALRIADQTVEAHPQRAAACCGDVECMKCASPCPEGTSADCCDIPISTSSSNVRECCPTSNVQECCPTDKVRKIDAGCCPKLERMDNSI